MSTTSRRSRSVTDPTIPPRRDDREGLASVSTFRSSGSTRPCPPPHRTAHRSGEPAPPPVGASLGLVVSGGHTNLYRVEDVTTSPPRPDDRRPIGEAVDKVAAMLELGHPVAPRWNVSPPKGPMAIDLPVANLGRGIDFSYSGLKTAVRYAIEGVPGRRARRPTVRRRGLVPGPRCRRSPQPAAIAAQPDARHLLVGGGVVANRPSVRCARRGKAGPRLRLRHDLGPGQRRDDRRPRGAAARGAAATPSTSPRSHERRLGRPSHHLTLDRYRVLGYRPRRSIRSSSSRPIRRPSSRAAASRLRVPVRSRRRQRPGRNKVETGAQGSCTSRPGWSPGDQRRQQQVNPDVAIGRLRLRLALKARTAASRDGHRRANSGAVVAQHPPADQLRRGLPARSRALDLIVATVGRRRRPHPRGHHEQLYDSCTTTPPSRCSIGSRVRRAEGLRK